MTTLEDIQNFGIDSVLDPRSTNQDWAKQYQLGFEAMRIAAVQVAVMTAQMRGVHVADIVAIRRAIEGIEKVDGLEMVDHKGLESDHGREEVIPDPKGDITIGPFFPEIEHVGQAIRDVQDAANRLVKDIEEATARVKAKAEEEAGTEAEADGSAPEASV